ncbi:trypsin-like serine peptidase [Sorangium sp. So ce117]|uniref:trypsin-like serine peptidase n=1 Tax=Sorangium sp. So ce117 TaxID=3133277 RepID=UPI003F6431A8
MMIPPDERAPVSERSLSDLPYSAICALKIKSRANGLVVTGTGFFIDPRVVITAGHCIYNGTHYNAYPDNAGWAASVEVIPAMKATAQAERVRPYGGKLVAYDHRHGKSKNPFRVPAEYIRSGEARWDYGAILLDSDLGAGLGAFSYERAAGEALEGVRASLAGYPEVIHNPETRFLDGERLCVHHMEGVKLGPDDVVSYRFDASPGQSGSPIWITERDSSHVAIAIHCQNEDASRNRGRRITSDVVENFRRWIAEARQPPSTADVP